MTTPKPITRPTHRTALATGMAAALILLGSCSHSAPEPADVKDTTAADTTPAPAPVPAAPTRASKPPAEKTARIDVPPPEEPAPGEQMQDDADATGMTAHVSHDETSAANMDAPADPAEN